MANVKGQKHSYIERNILVPLYVLSSRNNHSLGVASIRQAERRNVPLSLALHLEYVYIHFWSGLLEVHYCIGENGEKFKFL